MKLAMILLCIPAFAQQPRIANARLETHAIRAGLSSEMRAFTSAANAPEWAGYTVPRIPGNHGTCAHWLEKTASPVQLEGSGTLLVLFRLSNHAIDKVEAYSLDCELNAGGVPFHLLTGVSPAESIEYLVSIATAHKQAVMAIALHSDASADTALERLSVAAQPEKMREDVAFWLGSARGARGVAILKTMLDHDGSDRVREKLMFALLVSKEPSALALLLESAKNDRSPKVRGQALFWLAQKAGQKETAAILHAVADDPDTQVKKQAVFALGQLPRDEGIPLLIQVARTNANREVRKQAMFWLGQSQDQRAVKFFEEVLTK